MNSIIRTVCLLLTIMLFFSGCGENVDLRGKVTFSDDGSPVPAGMVIFENDEFMSRASISPDGTYVVGSDSQNDGIPPGKYRIYIAHAVEKIGDDSSGMPVTRPLIDEKYFSGSTSGLSMEVGNSATSYDLSLDRYQVKK